MTLTEAISAKAHERVFGVDYDVGWIGFTNCGGFVTDGIIYSERWERPANGIAVSHTFICTGPNQGIEAHLENGVAQFAISKYSDDPNCKLYFKRPVGWTPALGARIAIAARNKPPFGCPYDKSLIVADFLCDTFLGHLANEATHGWLQRRLCDWLGRKGEFICSEVVAMALKQQPELAMRGCLQKDANEIDPQELFDDTILFPS